MPRKGNTSGLRTDQAAPRSRLGTTKDDVGVSLSFAHYRSETECLSSWGPSDLKSLVGAIEKMRDMTVTQFRNSSLCSPHRKGSKIPKRFSRPVSVAKDFRMHEVRVDKSNAARIHGVIENSIFYLIWLDRKHEVFPE
ncbi:hypothetical protein HME9302_00591 [Alteripontixanthobacter maritimus]|uniref:Uncharacterized protein n=1 Tax=Alteripontixanthobacter maritimus TaxID=2161824 RepID=A0A369Q3D6_9SPHN|nr:hypothetical protein [Alteripontixanthobacter maritimus]RDC59403.1 hypothetical protein HME9302_00591 [Alteripontixanthobacter maritimus]